MDEKTIQKIMMDNKATNNDILAIIVTILRTVKELRIRVDTRIDNIKLKKGDPGNHGNNYVLTDFDREQIATLIKIPEFEISKEDKKLIASLVQIPVTEKVIEKTEIIRELPQVIETRREITSKELELIEKKFEKNIPKFGYEIRNALEVLIGDERLKMDAIDGLEEALQEIKKLIEKARLQKSFGSGNNPAGGGRGHIKNFDLSPFLNGITKTFNLPANWAIINIVCSSFPGALRPVIDYTYTPTSVTFTSEIDIFSTLASGQTVIVVYEES